MAHALLSWNTVASNFEEAPHDGTKTLTGLALTGVSLMLAGAALAQTMSPGQLGRTRLGTRAHHSSARAGAGPAGRRDFDGTGRPGPGAPQAPPGLNQPTPGTTTPADTITPGTTQLPPGRESADARHAGDSGHDRTGDADSAGVHARDPGVRNILDPVGRDRHATDQIRSAQQALQGTGMNPGPIDGVLGPRTQQAVRDYQKQQNLPQTGQLDTATLQKLGISM